MNIQECDAIVYLAQAGKALMLARKATGNGFVDDLCYNALREVETAIQAAASDTAEETV